MTANQEDAGVTNKLMTADTTAKLHWREPPSDELNAALQDDDCILRDGSRSNTFRNAVECLLPFPNSLTKDNLGYSDSKVHQIDSKGGVTQSLPELSAPVVPTDSNSNSTGKQVAHLTQPKAATGCHASDDLWLYTDQVPAGEEERAILGQQNSDIIGFAGGYKEGRQVSGYPLEMVTAIGSPDDDSWFRVPPVKTWPAIDSWSGAHSNIVHIVLSSFEEPPAIIIQTPDIMAIKDEEVALHPTQENAKTAEQMCLITADQDNSKLTAERGVENDKTLLKIQAGGTGVHSADHGDKEDRAVPLTEEHSSQVTSEEARSSSLLCTVASQNLCEFDMTDISPSAKCTTAICDSSEDIVPMKEGMSAGEEDIEIYSKKRIPSQVSVEEKVSNSECQQSSEERQMPEQESDALWKVTEDTLSQLYEEIKEGLKRSRNNEPLTFSGYSSESSTVKPVLEEEPGRSIDGRSPGTVLQRTTESVPHQNCYQTQSYPGAGENDSAVRQKGKPHLINLQGGRNERREFAMPSAPKCQRNIHFNTTGYTTSKGDQKQARFLETKSDRTFDRFGAFLSENKTEELFNVDKGKAACSDFPSGDHDEKVAFCCAESLDKDLFMPSSPGDVQQHLSRDKRSCETSDPVSNLGKDFSKLCILTGDTFFICEQEKTACITLDLNDSLGCATWAGQENGTGIDYTSALEHMKTHKTRCVGEVKQEEVLKMPHKTPRTSSGNKTSTRCKSKEKPASHQEKSKCGAAQASKKQETLIPQSKSLVTCEPPTANAGCQAVSVTDVETKEMTEKCTKTHGKKKKKQSQHSSGKDEAETLKEAASSPRQKADSVHASLTEQAGNNDKLPVLTSQANCLHKQNHLEVKNVTAKVKGKGIVFDRPVSATDTERSQSTGLAKQQGERILKCRHLFEVKAGKPPTESKPLKSSPLVKKEEQVASADTHHRKAYSEVVKQTSQIHKEVPKVLQNIRAEKLSDDPRSISLQCQFGAVSVGSCVVWTKEGAVLEQAERSAGDERLLSITISKPSSKDLGRYQCFLTCSLGTQTSEFYLTSDVLSELLPSQDHQTAEVVDGVEEDVKCTPLLFKEDFLSEQYFGENQPTSILTEQVHFGEGMHRRAFRTKLLGGMLPVFSPGHPCVLKVHNAISQGTKNNEELVRKNYSLAVEECSVQNTAREYIKAYTTVAKSAEDFGEVPEIIPILLVHRPSSDIPYATLEEELRGDFVKYSVKDGKEINLTRRDSEPGQKCCAFQHWVYNKTEGNLLVTDMQGVGMKLTDVGIATPKKGYKGFKGNCATSFIDQFKALHQCNKFCKLLGLKSIQPCQTKPKRTPPAPKPQTQPKKKPIVVNLKSKS